MVREAMATVDEKDDADQNQYYIKRFGEQQTYWRYIYGRINRI